jgi:hypothetical protein
MFNDNSPCARIRTRLKYKNLMIIIEIMMMALLDVWIHAWRCFMETICDVVLMLPFATLEEKP